MLIEKTRGQITREIALHNLATLTASQGATYIIVDSETQQQPENLVLKRKGDQLEIEVDDKPVAIIDQFYTEGTAASFSIGAEISAENIVASSEDTTKSDEGEVVVWPTSDGSGILWGALASAGALFSSNGSSSASEEVTPTPTPSSYNIVVSAVAGPFVSEVQVDIYDNNGNSLGSGQYDVASGQFKLNIASDYKGPFVVFVSDINGDQGDYLDEATNTLVSLGSEPLRAMGYANGTGDVYLSVTPLTELAARKANIADKATIDANKANGTQTVIVTEANLEANAQVATLFGLDDILAPVTTVVDVNFQTTDGINSAERYGEVLAQLSGADKHTGSLSNTLKQLEDAIVPQASSTTGQNSLAMNQEGVDLLKKGVEKFEEGENKDKADLGNSLVQPPIISSATDGINAAEKAAGITVGIKGAVAGDVVTVNWGGSIFTATISSTDFDASGLANLAVPSNLISSTQEGRTSVSYHINEGIESPATLILVDSTAPVVLSIDVADHSDTGLSNTDDISKETTPNLRIGLESADSSLVGGQLRLTSNGALIGSVTLTEADRSQGYIDITTSALGADGVKQLVATIVDKAGNESAATALSYTLDTNLQAATLSLNTGSDTGLSNTDNISQDATPTVRISLKSDAGLAGTTVQLNANGAPVGSAVISTTDISRGYIEIETSTLGIDGSKALTATLTDTAGNQSTSAIYAYTLDTTTPALSAKILDGLDSNPTPTVRISLDSSDSSLLGGKIDLYSGLGPIGSATISQANINTGYIDIKTRDLGDSGVKNIAISIKDIAGNTQTQSLSYTLKDTTPALPTVKVTNIDISEDSGTSSHDFITNVASQTVTATLSEALAEGEVLYGSADGGANWVNINNMIGSDTTTLTWTGVTLNGSSSLRFKVRNSLGDNGEETSQTYTLDSKAATAPTLDLVESSDTGTLNTDDISYDTTPTIRISLDGQDTSLTGGKVILSSGASAVGSVNITATDLSNGYVEITSSALGEDGIKALSATVEDLAGNRTNSTDTLSYTLDTVATETVNNITIGEDTGISGEDFVTSISNQWVRGTLNTQLASGDTLYGSSDGGENWVNLNNMLGEDGTQLSWSSVSLSGSSSIRFKVTDIAGNSSTESRQDYVLDTIAPNIPTLNIVGEDSDTGASSADKISRDTTPTVRISLDGEDASLEGGKANVTLNGSVVGWASITNTDLSNGYVEVTTSSLGEDGVKTLSATVEDLAGNSSSSSASLQYTLDTTVPNIPTLYVVGEDSDTGASSSDNISSDDTPTIRITLDGEDSSLDGEDSSFGGEDSSFGGEDSSLEGKASIMLNGEEVGFANITREDLNNGYVDITTSSLGEDGIKALSATVEDLAGNSSSSSSSLSYTLDTVAPSILNLNVENAYANGNQLIFTLQDGLNLDSTNIAAASAFTVTGSVSNTITVNSLSVDATAKTVTLTLTSTVVPGETLQLSYTGPTANNDVSAIQDIAGNDLASFSTLAIENITPIRVIVETTGAYIDANGDGIKGEDEVTTASFASGDNADLANKQVTIHYNAIPSTALDLTGFGEDDQIELDISAILSPSSLIGLSYLEKVQDYNTFADNKYYYIEYINSPNKAIGIDISGNLLVGTKTSRHYTDRFSIGSNSYHTSYLHDVTFNNTNTIGNNAGSVNFEDIDFLVYSVSGPGSGSI
ncbi:hypothetical protein BTE48_10325 [Oceanospirillum multiglobuliferum]|uniref:Bacterial Ig-like domain-containing protein n=2 Tax=Oceanospirillum multiglobuliferum TaxID=64969 RepID=A0A1V4T3G7_9GAMM|nr:hypothetical protein BTE48_10325 [Oceanospirillum multiglobuliferum]